MTQFALFRGTIELERQLKEMVQPKSTMNVFTKGSLLYHLEHPETPVYKHRRHHNYMKTMQAYINGLPPYELLYTSKDQLPKYEPIH